MVVPSVGLCWAGLSLRFGGQVGFGALSVGGVLLPWSGVSWTLAGATSWRGDI